MIFFVAQFYKCKALIRETGPDASIIFLRVSPPSLLGGCLRAIPADALRHLPVLQKSNTN